MPRRCREDEKLQAWSQPWLGQGDLVADLPLPQLIDAEITPGADVDLQRTFGARLKQAAPNARAGRSQPLDRAAARTGRRGALWSAYGILLLIAVATAAAVSFATRAGLDAHHEMVALLHQMGAQSRASSPRAFEWHYFLRRSAQPRRARCSPLSSFWRRAGWNLRRRGGAVPAAAGAQTDRNALASGGSGGSGG